MSSTRTSERELSVLADIYRRAVERYEEANAPGVTSTKGDDAKGSENVSRHSEYTR